MGTLNIPYITIDDSSATQTDTSFLNTSNITTMINGTTAGTSRDCIWRFQVPVSTVIADITAAKIKVQAYSPGTFYGSVGVTANTNSATSATTPNKPSEIWSNRINASSVTWNQSTTTSNFQFIESADFVTQLKDALTATTAVGGFYNISVVWHGTVQSSPTGSVQVYTLEHSTQAAYAGTLILSSEVPSFTQSVSPTALAPAPLVSNIVLYRLQEDQTSYHDGFAGSSVRRTFNLFSSANTAPVGGYPVMVWVHGGSFIGGSNVPNQYMIQACLQNGYAIAAPWYKVVDAGVANSTGSYPHPHAVQDIVCFTKHIIDNKLTYKINTDNLIGGGESAGGHIMLDAALCLDDPNIDSYDMAYDPTSQPNRHADYPDLNITEGRNITGISYKAIFSWVGPVNIERTKALTLIAGSAVLSYLGMDGGGSMAAVKGEGDLDSYIIGKLRPNYFNIQGIISNTQNMGIYESKTPTKPSFPIGYASMVDDDTVPNGAGLSPLVGALVNLPYEICDYSSTGKISKNGLTFKRTCYGSPIGGLTFNLPNENNIYQNYTFVSATGSGQALGAAHGAAMSYRPNITFFLEWLDVILPTINDEPILDYTSIGNRNHIIPKQVAKASDGGFVPNLEVGQTWPRNGPRNYGTVFMSTTGNDLNTGSLSSPVRTFNRAYALCPSGGVITVRAGVYEEGSTAGGIAISKPLTVQAYPGESVWFDGSTVVSGWTGTGPWVKTGWAFNAGNTSGFTTSDKPNVTYYMDQLFINDVSQVQVATTAPNPGEFSVVGGNIYLGSDPTGKTVRVSQYRGLFVVSQKVVLSNIGVRRYASGATATNTDATSSQGNEVIYFGGASNGSTIEDCRFVDNSHIAVSVGKSAFTIRGNTFTRSGKTHIGIGGSTGGDGLVFTGNTLSDNNLGGWPAEPTTAAVKIVRTNGATITDNVISNTFGSYGIWLDLSCTRCVIARNAITGTAGAKTGILFEISGGGLLGGVQYWSYIVDNNVTGPYQFGITIFDSSYVKVWNNTVEGCADLGFRIIQDSRPINGILNVSTLGNYNVGSLDFLVHNIEFVNNKIGTVVNYAQVAAYNMTGTWPPVGDTMFDRFEGNSFAVGAKPVVMWGSPVPPSSLDGRVNYSTVDQLDARVLFVSNGWNNISGLGVSPIQPPPDVAALIE